MSTPKKEHLFLLIQSLTRAEKRHFKLMAAASGKGSKVYVQVFDYLVRQPVYDENALRNAFAGEAFLKQLHVCKNYLQQMILRSLRHYHENCSRAVQVRALLHEVEILFRKGLLPLCDSRLRKAVNLASRLEDPQIQLDVINWQRRLLLARTGASQSREELNQLHASETAVLKRAENLHEYWYLSVNLFEIVGDPDRPADALVHEKPSHPLLAPDAQPATFQARVLFYYAQQGLAYMRGDTESALSWSDTLIDYLKTCPEIIEERPESLITALNNKASLLLHHQRYDDIKVILQEIRHFQKSNAVNVRSSLAFKAVLQSYNLELELYRDAGRFQEGAALVETVYADIEDHSSLVPIDYHLLLLYQMAYLLFMQGKPQRALHFLNKLLNLRAGNVRLDVQRFARFLNLIIHYELGNSMILRYAVDACRRFLRNKHLQGYERPLLRFFARLSTALPEQERDLFEGLRQTLFKEVPQAEVSGINDYLDLQGWIERQLAAESAVSASMPS